MRRNRNPARDIIPNAVLFELIAGVERSNLFQPLSPSSPKLASRAAIQSDGADGFHRCRRYSAPILHLRSDAGVRIVITQLREVLDPRKLCSAMLSVDVHG